MSDYIDTDDLILARKFLGQSRPSSAASMKALSHRVPIETRLGYWSDLMPNANIFQLDVRKTTDIHICLAKVQQGLTNHIPITCMALDSRIRYANN
jgi:hypothetical protein